MSERDETEVKKHIKALNNKIVQRADELAWEHITNFAHTVSRHGIIGAAITLEYRTVAGDDTLRVQINLSNFGASISGSVFHNHVDDVSAFMEMLGQATEIANDYLVSLERAGGEFK